MLIVMSMQQKKKSLTLVTFKNDINLNVKTPYIKKTLIKLLVSF